MSVLAFCLDEIVTASGSPWREPLETGETPPIEITLLYAARVHYAVTGDIGETVAAADAERRLLDFCRFATGPPP